jgi:hypothetical protein
MNKLIQEANCSVTINVEPVPFAGMITLIESKHKELTDEEILQFQDKVPYTLGSDLIDFARAILKKAQNG